MQPLDLKNKNSSNILFFTQTDAPYQNDSMWKLLEHSSLSEPFLMN